MPRSRFLNAAGNSGTRITGKKHLLGYEPETKTEKEIQKVQCLNQHQSTDSAQT